MVQDCIAHMHSYAHMHAHSGYRECFFKFSSCLERRCKHGHINNGFDVILQQRSITISHSSCTRTTPVIFLQGLCAFGALSRPSLMASLYHCDNIPIILLSSEMFHINIKAQACK